MTDITENYPSSQFMGYEARREEADRARDLKRLKAVDSSTNFLLGEMMYVGKLVGHHQNIADVEDINEKIEAAYKKIYDHLNKPEAEEEQDLSDANQNAQDSIPLEKHPDLLDMGGMPLELDKLDKQWLKELGVNATLDKAEIQNQIKNKLQAKLKNAIKIAAKLQQQLKPTGKPELKQANELVIKYKMTLEDLKNKPILQPEVPVYQPRPQAPKPSPFM